ncbi:MAG TPA: TIGR03620 family F420-dependent LLM class oxidoreductase [Gaiellaceae bacterium]|nr:TIGR03620 family F420-dependent LLM class oxidoreductase [Gaiellaceae bacterium]
MTLGRIGVWSSAPAVLPTDEVRAGVAAIEELGYGSLWYPEGLGREAFSLGASLLAWTNRIVVGVGIANLYARDAWAMAAGAEGLGEAYPGRFVLGIGVSHQPLVERRGHGYGSPVATMHGYLDAMAEARSSQPPPPEPVPRVLAALGPKMLELAAARSDGAHPYFVPVEHTAQARAILGDGPLLVPEVTVVLETDPAEARRLGREFAERYLAMANYRNNLLRLGFEPGELEGGGSDRLIDAVIAWGDADAVAERIRAHLAAGADHVVVQPLPSGRFCIDQLTTLAPLLLANAP